MQKLPVTALASASSRPTPTHIATSDAVDVDESSTSSLLHLLEVSFSGQSNLTCLGNENICGQFGYSDQIPSDTDVCIGPVAETCRPQNLFSDIVNDQHRFRMEANEGCSKLELVSSSQCGSNEHTEALIKFG
ncbi:unnamed protein product [Protopolystoma xenopodis]|uniref:Uncharacterized protein n=1 Tax=Protopolystoma xenopodis TaxID=117903 RepID=A0A448XBH4_9PLAT|nr:unnamed protein product [Protopolystoma xenopodis]